MTATAIREEVRKLPRMEQLSLIQYIVQILEEDDDFALSETWKEALDKRDEGYRAGTEKLHDWNEARDSIGLHHRLSHRCLQKIFSLLSSTR